MSNEAIGYAGEFRIGNAASPEVFTKLGNMVSISWGGRARDAVEISNADSPSMHKEFIAGMIDAGAVTVALDATELNIEALNAEYAKGTTGNTNYQVLFPTNPNSVLLAFSGFMQSGPDLDNPHDDKVGLSVVFKISGAPTLSNP